MKTKHEIANEYVYSATMALADAITEDIRELTKDGGEVEIYPNYYEYGEEHDDCWLASMNNDKVYLTKCGSLITLDDMPIQDLININDALLYAAYHVIS